MAQLIPRLLPIQQEGRGTATTGHLLQIHQGSHNEQIGGRRSNNKSLHRSGVQGMTSVLKKRTGDDTLVFQNSFRFYRGILGNSLAKPFNFWYSVCCTTHRSHSSFSLPGGGCLARYASGDLLISRFRRPLYYPMRIQQNVLTTVIANVASSWCIHGGALS